jgi:hypothetical protein
VSVSSRWRLLRRFVVHDESMSPTLQPGDGLIGVRSGRARAGQLRVFEHPERPGFWMVKRVATVGDGTMWVLSDDRSRPTVDSRRLGNIGVAGSYRVVLRVPIGARRAPPTS